MALSKVKGPTHFLISQISSLLFSNLRFAHHSARRRIHASRLSSGCNDLFAMQNLKSSIFWPHFDISPCRYNDLSRTPRTETSGYDKCVFDVSLRSFDSHALLHDRKSSKRVIHPGISSVVGCITRRRACSCFTVSSKSRPDISESERRVRSDRPGSGTGPSDRRCLRGQCHRRHGLFIIQ